MKNKKWQRLTSLLLVVCMVFGMSVNVFAVDYCDCTTPTGCDFVNCTTCEKRVLGQHPDRNGDEHCDYCGFGLDHECEIYYDADGHWSDCHSEKDRIPHIYGRYNDPNQCPCGYVKDGDVKLPEPTVETYKITVNPSENGSVDAVEDNGVQLSITWPLVYTAAEDTEVTLSVTPDAGYELETLTVVDATGKEVEVTANYTFTMPDSNVTVTASFKQKAIERKVRVNYYDNDGDYIFSAGNKVYEKGSFGFDSEKLQNAAANAGAPAGFTTKVIGWATEPNQLVPTLTPETLGTAYHSTVVKYLVDNGFVTVNTAADGSESVAFYAVFEADKVTVRFNNEDGTKVLETRSKKYVGDSSIGFTQAGSNLINKVNAEAPAGYHFGAGWAVKPNGEAVITTNSHKVKDLVDNFGATLKNEDGNWYIDVYAVWEANNYTVILNYGDGEPETIDTNYEGTVDLSPEEYKYGDLDLVKWMYGSEEEGTAVAVEAKEHNVKDLVAFADENNNIVLNAVYENAALTPAIKVPYRITYFTQKDDGSYVSEVQYKSAAVGESVTADYSVEPGFILGKKSKVDGTVIVPNPAGATSMDEVKMLDLVVYYDALTDVTITVEWDDDNNRDGLRVDGKDVLVELLTNGNKDSGKKVKLSASEESDSATFSMLKFDNGNEIAYSVNDVNGKSIHNLPDGYTVEVSNEGNEWTVVLKHEPARMDMDVTVVWDDEDNRDGFRPSDMKLELVKNKDKQGDKKIPITTEDNKTYTYENLYVYENGEKINYSVVGAFRPASYSETVTGNMEDGYTVTLKHTPETIDISGTINWDDHYNNDGFRPESVTVNLNGGDVSKSVVVNSTDSDVWNYAFEGVYKYYNGEVIEYVVSQNPLANGYTTSVEGFEITNSRPLDTVNNVQVTLVWDDDNDRDGKRPEANEVTVNLLGKPLYVPVLFRWIPGDTWIADSSTPAVNGNTWTYNFDLTDVNGNNKFYNKDEVLFIAELADEKALEDLGYEIIPSDDGTTITLKHIPEEVSFSGEIEWIDDNDRDGIRPENYVTVKLYKVTTDSYGREWETNVHTVTTGKNSNTEYSFASNNNVTLYKYENGEEIKYVAKVVSVDGYTSEFSASEAVSATHVPETIDISGTITWDDLNNNDGFRPDAVTVTLKDGDETVNEKGAVSSYNFEKVYKYKNQGQEIEYTVVFEDVEKYEKEQDGYNVTYRHTIERAGTTVTVVWDDDNNRDGVRPEADSIGVELLGKPLESLLPRLLRTILGDEPVVYAESTFSESDANTWVYEFTNANKFFEGKEVIFQTQPTEETLNLLEAKGYNVDINNDTNTITLSRTPDVYSKVKAEIVWDDDDNRDGIRPENVVIRMFGSNGYSNTYNEKDGNWRHNFSSTAEKPIYVNEPVKNGVVYNVEVRDAVEGYISTVSGDVDSGFVITMTHMPELIDISGTITWKDGSDYDNIRPDSVVIKLIGDDKEYEETFNSMAGNVWEYELAGVHKYLNGKEIEYSVSQNKVPGYTTTIKNFDITNIHSPNYPEIEDEPEEKVVVKVKWFNDDSSYRPEEVTVQLYKDGRKYRAAAELSADKDTYENWRYVWEDVNEDEDTEWSIKVNGIPSEYIYEIEQVRSSYFVVNCTLNENEVKKNPETGAF